MYRSLRALIPIDTCHLGAGKQGGDDNRRCRLTRDEVRSPMSRPERELQPNRSASDRFGFELRTWRKARNMTLARLGDAVHVSDDLVRLIETAERRSSRDFAERCDRVLETCGLLVRLWENADDEARRQKIPPVQTDNQAAETDKFAVGSAGPVTGTTASEMIVVEMRTLNGE